MQLSYWSSSPELADKGVFPYFGRTYPSDDVAGRLVPLIVQHFGWTNVAVINVLDTYAIHYVAVFETRMVALGMNVISKAGFPNGDAENARAAVRDTARAGANIIFMLCFDNDMESMCAAPHSPMICCMLRAHELLLTALTCSHTLHPQS